MAGSFYAGGPGGNGDVLPRALLRKLEALSYPELGSASLEGETYCKIILWLEEEKIRFLEPAQRKGLREFGDQFLRHFTAYAQDLNVNVDALSMEDGQSKLRVLNHLTNLAIHDVYRDRVENQSMVLSVPAYPLAGGVEDKQMLQDLVPDLNRMLDLYQLPKLQKTAADNDTIAALRCVKTRMCQKGIGAVEFDMSQLPAGLDVEDPEVRKTATILRLLHNIEMGQLQVNVSTVLNDLQQLTANPRTDAKLGRVGT